MADQSKFEFERGYLIACTNMLNLHGDIVIAADTFGMLDISDADIRKMKLSKYDMDALKKIRAELSQRTKYPSLPVAEIPHQKPIWRS